MTNKITPKKCRNEEYVPYRSLQSSSHLIGAPYAQLKKKNCEIDVFMFKVFG